MADAGVLTPTLDPAPVLRALRRLDGRATVADITRKYGFRHGNVFHAGDGNLHPLIMYDAGIPGQLETAERMGADILSLCIAAGGTVTGVARYLKEKNPDVRIVGVDPGRQFDRGADQRAGIGAVPLRRRLRDRGGQNQHQNEAHEFTGLHDLHGS